MFSKSAVLFAVFTFTFGPAANAQIHYDAAPEAVVQSEGGRLQGAEPAPGIRAFLGIPYAKPPVGSLRWQPPEPFGSWTGVRPALAHGNPCPQQKFGWNNVAAEHGSEDCLFLNVWAPAAGEKHPVMVYIHGGSNVAGTSAEELSSGFALVPRGVVLVTLDYRLGIFGFFRTPALDAESPHRASGNYGLLDQIAALDWVRKNISHFGGDPGNVTIFGQSAGAVDTGLLMASPLARGLFARAVEESGQVVGLMPTATQTQSETAWSTVARALGPDLAAMRSSSTADVLKADGEAPKPPFENFWGYRGASVDGWVLPALPSSIFAEGKEASVPLIIGSNVQEIVPRNQPASATDHLIEAVVGPEKAQTLEQDYTHPPVNPLEGDTGARFQTDRDFRCPVRQVAAWHASHGFPTFVYQFDRSAGTDKPAQHSSELGFVFGYFPSHKETTTDDTVASMLQSYWTTFARTGKPQGTGSPAWPRFDPNRGNYLHFATTDTTPFVAKDLGGKPCLILTGEALPAGR